MTTSLPCRRIQQRGAQQSEVRTNQRTKLREHFSDYTNNKDHKDDLLVSKQYTKRKRAPHHCYSLPATATHHANDEESESVRYIKPNGSFQMPIKLSRGEHTRCTPTAAGRIQRRAHLQGVVRCFWLDFELCHGDGSNLQGHWRPERLSGTF